MRITVVGSADAFNSAGRAHSCYVVDGVGTKPMMIDFGATALAALKRAGRDPRELGAILITHLHGDHIGGMPFLRIDGMYNLFRVEPLEIVGPIGTKARLDALLAVAYGELKHLDTAYEIRIREIAPGEPTEVLGARLLGFPAEHMDPPERPMCLRLTAPDGRSVAFSGDTAMCPGLFEAADGVDLLVAECTAMRPPAGRHCTWQEWEEALPKIGAKRVLLTHLNDEVREKAPTLRVPGADLAFAEDGMIIEI